MRQITFVLIMVCAAFRSTGAQGPDVQVPLETAIKQLAAGELNTSGGFVYFDTAAMRRALTAVGKDDMSVTGFSALFPGQRTFLVASLSDSVAGGIRNGALYVAVTSARKTPTGIEFQVRGAIGAIGPFFTGSLGFYEAIASGGVWTVKLLQRRVY